MDYILQAPFWDGMVMHPRGSKLSFPQGKAPKSAKAVEDPLDDEHELPLPKGKAK